MSITSYFLGGPVWSNKDWQGTLYTARAKPADMLAQYATTFNTVEGGQTFYGLPATDTILRWRDTVPPDFRFCFKFPRTITHDKRLIDCQRETDAFIDLMLHLHGRIGLLWLQFPPAVNSRYLSYIHHYLDQLPCDFHYAVEVRHPTFAAKTPGDRDLNHILAEHHANRITFHTQTLHAIDTTDPDILAAQRKKPNLPARLTATDNRPMVRYVGHTQVEPNRAPLNKLARQTATWIQAGKLPFIFIHSPDDVQVPQLCRLFHDQLTKHLQDLRHPGDLPPYQGQTEYYQPDLF